MGIVSQFIEKAVNSIHKESFLVVKTGEDYRLGVGYRLEEDMFFVEVLVKFCRGDDVDLKHLSEVVEDLNLLEMFGYSIRCEDDNCLYAEKRVQGCNIVNEIEVIDGLRRRR